MSTKVFLSWTSPDKDIVTPLRDRLYGAGIGVWEYTEEMHAGDDIPDRIMAEIDDSELAVICLSDAAAKRKWLVSEIAWCRRAQKEGTLKAILPVKVGTLSDEVRDELLLPPESYTFDMTNAEKAEDAVLRLVNDILRRLGRDGPIVVPAALFTLTADEYGALAKTPAALDVLSDVCLATGMAAPPQLLIDLAERYGKTVEEFTPFAAGVPLMRAVRDVEQSINERRAGKQRPIFIRWCHQEFTKPGEQQDAAIRELWRTRSSLLIVDAVAMLLQRVKQNLLDLPQLTDRSQSAWIWLPPYTRRTGALPAMMKLSARIANFIDPFDDWSKAQADYPVAFDIGTDVSLRQWLQRTFRDVAGGRVNKQRAERVKQSQPNVAIGPNNLFAG